ncbi:MAG: hypothetical protein PVH29_09365 [Candidatus Zixiibacteriota bacterium]|jgi:hypothetical protein
MVTKYFRWVAVAAFAVGVGLLVGCSEVGEPTTPLATTDTDEDYGVFGTVYDNEDESVANPVPNCDCSVYCWDCQTFVFGSDTSNQYGGYECRTTPSVASAHDTHEMTVYGSTNGMTITHESYMFEFSAPKDLDVNLYPAGGDD